MVSGLTNYAQKELANKKLIENKSGKYELTDTGRLVSRKLRAFEIVRLVQFGLVILMFNTLCDYF